MAAKKRKKVGAGERGKTRATDNPRHRAVPDPIAAALGARIRAMRLRKGLKLVEFVGISDLGRGFVHELERGLAAPTLLTLCRVASALEVSLVDLVAGVGPNAERWEDIVEEAEKVPPHTFRELGRQFVNELCTAASPDTK